MWHTTLMCLLLYRTRGNEVVHHRPVFTGDVFERVEVQGLGSTKKKSIMVLQHPCALRTNGVDLTDRLLIAEVRTHPLIVIKAWSGHLSKIPLPDLVPTVDSGRRHQAAFFDQPYFVAPENLYLAKRIACLSQVGVNLLLQRWCITTVERLYPRPRTKRSPALPMRRRTSSKSGVTSALPTRISTSPKRLLTRSSGCVRMPEQDSVVNVCSKIRKAEAPSGETCGQNCAVSMRIRGADSHVPAQSCGCVRSVPNHSSPGVPRCSGVH